jgi:hypothetical protein
MSAKLHKDDSKWLGINGSLNEMERTLLESQFETDTDWDVESIKKELVAIKKIKRMCLLKLFTFLPEALFASIIATKHENQIRRQLNKLYFKFLFNNIDYNNFKKELIRISKDDILLV